MMSLVYINWINQLIITGKWLDTCILVISLHHMHETYLYNMISLQFQYYMMNFDIPATFQLPFGMRWSDLMMELDNMSEMMMAGSSNLTDLRGMVQHLQSMAMDRTTRYVLLYTDISL